MIENDEQLIQAMETINTGIQAVQDYLEERNCPEGRIRFPRGYLRTCDCHRNKYPYITCPTLKTNIAYSLMTTDVFRWLLNRTDLAGQAKNLIIKQNIVQIGAIIEAVTKHYLKGEGSRKSFAKRLDRLKALHIIDQALKEKLLEVWEQRNNIHLHSLTTREYHQYEIIDFNNAVRALHELNEKLTLRGALPPSI